MRPKREHIFVITILLVGWAVWLHRMGLNDHDDAVSNELLFARAPVMQILCCNPWPDQSPLYFLVLHVVRRFGESPFAIQLLNALLLTATLLVARAVALTLSSSTGVALGALALGAISPASLWLVRNGRMYSLQLLFAALVVFFVLRYLDRGRRWDLAALSAVCVLNIYTHFIGFLITALLLAALFVETWREQRHTLIRPAIATGAILILVVPQIVRLLLLAGAGVPLNPEFSLPGLSRAFFERVSWFWFMNSTWGSLSRGHAAVTAVYLGSIAALAMTGLALVRRPAALIIGLSTVVPLFTLGLAASRMDVRDRYFLWALPLVWIVVANGALGARTSWPIPAAARDALQGVRAALFLAVVGGSVVLLWNKLPDRYPEWTKLMSGLEQVYHASMVTYMPPGPPVGTPRWLGSQLDLPAGLQDIRELTAATRARFIDEVEQKKEFIFLIHWTYANDELRWRARFLEERGYRQTVLPVWGAHAQIFTQREIEDFTRKSHIEANAPPQTIVARMRHRLAETRSAGSGRAELAEAAVARVQPDGTILEGRVFSSQHGESGSWKLGPLEWDAVEQIRTSSGGVDRDVILAHPRTDSVLAVAFPAVQMDRSLRLLYGIADSGVRYTSGADVYLSVYVNGERKAQAVCANMPGWKDLAVDTDALRGQRGDVVLLISTADDRSRHFAFQLETTGRAAPGELPDPHEPTPVSIALTGGATLSGSLEHLTVYRLAAAQRIDARRDRRSYSAADMHEAPGPDEEGSIRSRWALGPFFWDGVGLSRQRSGGEVREGLWAHPKDGTVLVIEGRTVVGKRLRGYAGLTDFSIARAAERRVTAPVHIRISIDDQTVLDRNVTRARGWSNFAVAIPNGTDERRLRIEITSASDSWAHFVFDVWSE